jgi:hypothetical protein
VQWLASGTAQSLRPNWIDEEEHALFRPLLEKCVREMSAAADEGKPYPYELNLLASPAEIIATLEAHRGNWPPSGQALYDAAMAAGAARAKKARQLQEKNWRLIDAWQAGELHLYGRNDRSGQFERINPGLENYSDLELDGIEIIGNDMFMDGAGPSARPMYRAISIEWRALLDWAGWSGTDTNTDPNEAPASGERMVPGSPEEAATNLSDRSPQQPPADSEQAPANAEAPIEADAAGRGSTDTSVAPIRTGVAGRPTSIHLILPEAERRLTSGPVPSTLKEFAEQMSAWFSTTQHAKDGWPVPKGDSLANALRDLYNPYRPQRKTPPT